MDKRLDEREKEIERLNNIINELEKYIENEYLAYRPEDIQHYYGKDILNKLQELKGSDKEWEV